MRGTRALVLCGLAAGAALAAGRTARGGDAPSGAGATVPWTTRRGADAIVAFGERVPDPYRWLEDGAATEVVRWEDAQTARADALLRSLPGHDVVAARADAESVQARAGGAPFWRYGRLYVRRWAEGGRSVVLEEYVPPDYRTARVVLQLRVGLALGMSAVAPSPSGRHVAYAVGDPSSDRRRIAVHDLDAPSAPDVVVAAGVRWPTIEWAPDGTGFWWAWQRVDLARADAPARVTAELRFHRVGDDPDNAERVLLPAGDRARCVGLRGSSDGTAVFVTTVDREGRSDVHELVRDGAKTQVRDVWVGRRGVAEPDRWLGTTYLRTTADAPEGRWIAAADGHETWTGAWRTVLAPTDGVLEQVVPAWDRFVAHVRDGGGSRLFVYTLGGIRLGFVRLPSAGHVSWVEGLPGWGQVYFGHEDLARPPSVHRVRVVGGAVEVEEVSRSTTSVDLSRLVVERFRVRAPDDADVPVEVLRRRDVPFDGRAPTLVHAYGGFGIVHAGRWDTRGALFADLGGVLVVAGVRGGGELGAGWADAARGVRRHVASDDLVAVVAHLVAQRRADPRRVAYVGGSNGGLVVLAAACRRPELVRAVVCEVPVADMLRFPSIGVGAAWTNEYGDPATEEGFRALRALSPVHAEVATPRPALLVSAARLDERADPAHARKLVAAWQAGPTKGPAILRVFPSSGHALEHGSDGWSVLVDSLAFLASELGLDVGTTAGGGPSSGRR